MGDSNKKEASRRQRNSGHRKNIICQESAAIEATEMVIEIRRSGAEGRIAGEGHVGLGFDTAAESPVYPLRPELFPTRNPADRFSVTARL